MIGASIAAVHRLPLRPPARYVVHAWSEDYYRSAIDLLLDVKEKDKYQLELDAVLARLDAGQCA